MEGTFPTGNHLVTVDQPISTDAGDLKLALYRSFLPVPADDVFPPCQGSDFEDEKMPGALVTVKGDGVVLSKGRKRIRLRVTNTGDRAIQVGNIHEHQGLWLMIALDYRLARTTTSSRRIPNWTSTDCNPTDSI